MVRLPCQEAEVKHRKRRLCEVLKKPNGRLRKLELPNRPFPDHEFLQPRLCSDLVLKKTSNPMQK